MPARGVSPFFPGSLACASFCLALRFLCLLAGLFPWPLELQAQSPPAGLPPGNLLQTVRQSGLIFDGTVTGIQPEFGQGKTPQTYRVSFQVRQGVKGVSTGASFAIREWAGLWAAGTGQPPRYRVGERAFLFLYPASRAGLTSPVGGRKGKLTVIAGQVSVPPDWMSSLGPAPPSAPAPAAPTATKPAPAQPGQTPPARVPVTWLAQRVAQVGLTPKGGE